jgi:CheY-like chemotaxis protein
MTKVLVVDDEEPIRKLISAVLEDEGYAVVEAAHGMEALEVLPREQPQLVLMDLMMPVLDGRETIRRMRAAPELRHVPVVLMSAADPPPIDDSVAGFLAKPFHLSELLNMVTSALAL